MATGIQNNVNINLHTDFGHSPLGESSQTLTAGKAPQPRVPGAQQQQARVSGGERLLNALTPSGMRVGIKARAAMEDGSQATSKVLQTLRHNNEVSLPGLRTQMAQARQALAPLEGMGHDRQEAMRARMDVHLAKMSGSELMSLSDSLGKLLPTLTDELPDEDITALVHLYQQAQQRITGGLQSLAQHGATVALQPELTQIRTALGESPAAAAKAYAAFESATADLLQDADMNGLTNQKQKQTRTETVKAVLDQAVELGLLSEDQLTSLLSALPPPKQMALAEQSPLMLIGSGSTFAQAIDTIVAPLRPQIEAARQTYGDALAGLGTALEGLARGTGPNSSVSDTLGALNSTMTAFETMARQLHDIGLPLLDADAVASLRYDMLQSFVRTLDSGQTRALHQALQGPDAQALHKKLEDWSIQVTDRIDSRADPLFNSAMRLGDCARVMAELSMIVEDEIDLRAGQPGAAKAGLAAPASTQPRTSDADLAIELRDTFKLPQPTLRALVEDDAYSHLLPGFFGFLDKTHQPDNRNFLQQMMAYRAAPGLDAAKDFVRNCIQDPKATFTSSFSDPVDDSPPSVNIDHKLTVIFYDLVNDAQPGFVFDQTAFDEAVGEAYGEVRTMLGGQIGGNRPFHDYLRTHAGTACID